MHAVKVLWTFSEYLACLLNGRNFGNGWIIFGFEFGMNLGGPWSPVVILMAQWVMFSLQNTSSPYWASRGSDGFDHQEPEKVAAIGEGAITVNWLHSRISCLSGSSRPGGRVGRRLGHEYETCASMLIKWRNVSNKNNSKRDPVIVPVVTPAKDQWNRLCAKISEHTVPFQIRNKSENTSSPLTETL